MNKLSVMAKPAESQVPMWSRVIAYTFGIPIRLLQSIVGVMFIPMIIMEKGDVREGWKILKDIWTEPLDMRAGDDGGMF